MGFFHLQRESLDSTRPARGPPSYNSIRYNAHRVGTDSTLVGLDYKEVSSTRSLAEPGYTPKLSDTEKDAGTLEGKAAHSRSGLWARGKRVIERLSSGRLRPKLRRLDTEETTVRRRHPKFATENFPEKLHTTSQPGTAFPSINEDTETQVVYTQPVWLRTMKPLLRRLQKFVKRAIRTTYDFLGCILFLGVREPRLGWAAYKVLKWPVLGFSLVSYGAFWTAWKILKLSLRIVAVIFKV
ncbi:hypothetical protein C8J57DRAFT_1225050 [Mycena rebaudengoi]|nr:hypothetical protein C8J57DRAFT_1225050 [Mycena rebaudengoi]